MHRIQMVTTSSWKLSYREIFVARSAKIKNGEFDLLRNMSEHKSSIITQTCKSPRIRGAPFCSINTVLVLCPHLNQTILQPAALLPLHQMTTGFTGE